MKIECVREKLQEELLRAVRMLGKGNSFPILSCILLEAKNSTLFIRATNLDLGIEISLPVKVEKDGKIAVPGTTLSHYISSLSLGNGVVFEEIEGNLSITTASGKTTIKAIPHDDFPMIPKLPRENSLGIPIDLFMKGLRSVWYSAAVSTMKPELSSIYISIIDGAMYFVATDAFRLAEKKIPVKNTLACKPILLPVKNCLDILRVFDNTEGEVEIVFNENQIAFYFNTCYVTSRLTDGIFPDYRQIIPPTGTTRVVVLKNDFLNSLKVATIFTNKFNQSKIAIRPREKRFEITTKNADIGENTEAVSAVLEGEDTDITINYRYLLDCFQSIFTDSVSFECTDTHKPIVVKGIGDTSFMYLIMPMNNS